MVVCIVVLCVAVLFLWFRFCIKELEEKIRCLAVGKVGDYRFERLLNYLNVFEYYNDEITIIKKPKKILDK